MWQSRIEIEYYSIMYFECITEFDTELLLGVGLIHASWTHQAFMHLSHIYEPHP